MDDAKIEAAARAVQRAYLERADGLTISATKTGRMTSKRIAICTGVWLWPRSQPSRTFEDAPSKSRAKVGGEELGDRERMQDQLRVDRYRAGAQDGYDCAQDDDEAEDLVVWVEQEREEEAEHQRELQERRDEHDRRDGEGGVEKAMRRRDEDARVDEPASVLAADLITLRRKDGMSRPRVTATVAAA